MIRVPKLSTTDEDLLENLEQLAERRQERLLFLLDHIDQAEEDLCDELINSPSMDQKLQIFQILTKQIQDSASLFERIIELKRPKVPVAPGSVDARQIHFHQEVVEGDGSGVRNRLQNLTPNQREALRKFIDSQRSLDITSVNGTKNGSKPKA